MNLITDRIIIRNFRFDDTIDLFEMLSDLETAKDSGWDHHKTLSDSHNSIVSHIYDSDTFVVMLKSNMKLIGTISLYDRTKKNIKIKELGFCLNKNYRKKGYMYEAINILLNYAFREMVIQEIITCHATYNTDCHTLINKFPFEEKEIIKNYKTLCDGTKCDVVKYTLNTQDYDKYIKGE